jgi:hypothetical protein
MICLVHIERTGGTTLAHVLRSHYGSFLTLTPWYYWSNEAESVVTSEELAVLLRFLPFTKGLGGHTTRSYLGYETVRAGDVRYITFLREPISRYLSQYYYQREVMGRDWTIARYVCEERFNNFMTRRISGTADLSRAVYELGHRFSFVGLTERMDESLVLLKRRFSLDSLDLRYKRLNRRMRRRRSTDVTQSHELWAQIQQNNSLDISLYDYVRHELFLRYIEEYGSDLEEDVLEFKKTNQDFHFSKLKRVRNVVYRRLVYQNLERVVRYRVHGTWRKSGNGS